MEARTFEVFADYNQFYLQDETVGPEQFLDDPWSDDNVEDLLVSEGARLSIGTIAATDVEVSVAVDDSAPDDADVDRWEHIAEARLEVPSGRFLVAGLGDHPPDAPRVDIPPGTYRARVHLRGRDGGQREECLIALWRSDDARPKVLKRAEIGR